MSDQPTPVGFEAYFKTDKFKRDIKTFFDAIAQLNKSLDSLSSNVTALNRTIQGFARDAKTAFESIGQSTTQMAQHTQREMQVMNQAVRDGGVLIGQTVKNTTTAVQPTAKQAGTNMGTAIMGGIIGGLAAHMPRFKSKLKGFAGLLDKTGNAMRDVGTTLGTVLGAAIGSAVAPGIGTGIGAALGSMLGKMGGWHFRAMAAVIEMFNNMRRAALRAFGKIISAAAKVTKALLKIALTPVRKFFNKLRQQGTQALADMRAELEHLYKTATEFQKIETALNAVVAAALVTEGRFETARDAMVAAIPISEQLRKALIDLSLVSPFPLEDIYGLYRKIAAYGVALDTSYELTEALIEIGAATGFSNEVLELLARNFAQVAKNGKIFQRDLYELANSGLDLAQVLREELGITVDEFNQRMQEGTISVQDLADALIAFSLTHYGGSAEALSKTIAGLQNRFETLKTVMMSDFMRPMLADILPTLHTVALAFGEVIKTGIFEDFGKTFVYMLRSIVGETDWSVNQIAKKILDFMQWLIELGTDLFIHGREMMEEWGFGLLRGAANAITALVNFISNTITELFEVQSPPKILPMIDTWGAKTIEEWFKGMTKADFSIINQILSPIESALSGLGLDSSVIQTKLQEVARMLSKSLKTGKLDTGLLDYIRSIGGEYGSALSKLIKQEFELAKAIKRVEKAQKALDKATEWYEESDEAVQKLVREYNELLRSGADEATLEAKLKEIRAMQDQRREAGELITKREKELKTAEENKNKLQETVDAQRDLVNLMIKLTKQTKGAGSAMEDMAKALKEAMGGAGDLSFNIDTAFREARRKIQEALGGLKDEWDRLVRAVKWELGIPIEPEYEFSWEYGQKPKIKNEENLLSELEPALAELGGKVLTLITEGADWDTFTANFTTTLTGIITDVANSPELQEAIKTTTEKIITGLVDGISASIPIIVPVVIELGGAIIEGIWEGIKQKLAEYFTPERVAKILTIILDAFTLFFLIFSPSHLMETEVGEPIVEGIIEGIKNKLEAVKETASNIWTNITDGLGELWEKAKEKGTLIAEGLKTGISDKFEEIKQTAGDVWDNIVDGFGNVWENAQGIGRKIIDGIKAGVASLSGVSLLTWARKVIGNIIQALWNAIGLGGTSSESPNSNSDSSTGATMTQGLTVTAPQLVSSINDLINYRPRPTSAYTPSIVHQTRTVYNVDMGGNIVRDNMDLALLQNSITKQLRRASYTA